MARWLKRIGLTLGLFGTLWLSPLTDYLPVNLLPLLIGLFDSEQPHVYYRVVPATAADNTLPLALLLAGAGLWLSGHYLYQHQR